MLLLLSFSFLSGFWITLVVLDKVFPQKCLGTCPICLEQMKTGQQIDMLPCKHSFHETCIDRWYLSGLSTGKKVGFLDCPVCRQWCGVKHLIINYIPIIEKIPLKRQQN